MLRLGRDQEYIVDFTNFRPTGCQDWTFSHQVFSVFLARYARRGIDF